jgi:hypothetical protein
VAVYGVASAYPRATLDFTLPAAPSPAATLTIAGLDDEWETLNPIAVDVNGEQIYEGPSPYRNWDGVGRGENADWTEIAFTIPAGILRAGANELAVRNLSPAASFNAPPYLLLSDATLEIPGLSPGQPPAPAAPATSQATFGADAWRGGFFRGDSRTYGRPWTAVYGAASAYPRAALRFRLDAPPAGPAILTITGLDDELPALNPIAIEVNGRQVFTGPSPFANWDGLGNGANAAWTQAEITIPANLLHAGRNEVAIANLSPSGNFDAPPYILLADTTLQVPGTTITPLAPDRSRRKGNGRGNGDG